MKGNNATYLDGFGVEHIPKETKEFVDNNLVTVSLLTIIYRFQPYDSIICGSFCIGFVGFMLKGKNLKNLTNLFLPGNFGKNDKIILEYFGINCN